MDHSYNLKHLQNNSWATELISCLAHIPPPNKPSETANLSPA